MGTREDLKGDNNKMCYWELTTFTGKKEFKKWAPHSIRNEDGFGYYCIQCKEHFKTLKYSKFVQKMKTHKQHLVLIHFRLKSCGNVTLHNVQPIIIGDHVIVHNGDFTTHATTLDWRGLMPLGFSDSWILAVELAEAWDVKTYDEYTIKDKDGKEKTEKMLRLITDEQRADIVLAKMKEISPKDFLANYLFISPTHVVASIGMGDYNSTKEKFYISSGDYQSAQMIYRTADLLSGLDLPTLFTQEDYSRTRTYWRDAYDKEYGSKDWTGETLIRRDGKWVTVEDDDDYWKRFDPSQQTAETHWTDDLEPFLKRNDLGEVIFTVNAETMANTTFSNHLQLDEFLKTELYNDVIQTHELSALRLWFDELVVEFEQTTGEKFLEFITSDDELPFYEEVEADAGLMSLFGDK